MTALFLPKMRNFYTLKDLDVNNKTVLLRCCFDVPLDSSKGALDPKRVRDDSRIKDAIPTIKYLIERNCKIILEPGWLGRPKGEDPQLTMAPVALRLQELLKEKRCLKHELRLTPNSLDGTKARSVYRNKEEVKKDASNVKEGQVLVLENVRMDAEANENDQEFSKFIASLAGANAIYVNEAEAQNHRKEATVISVPGFVLENGGKAAFGLKYENVINYIGDIAKLLEKEQRGPFVFFLSGKKIETQVGITSKISVTNSLLDKMKKGDVLIVQGAVTYTFLLANKYLNLIKEKMEEIYPIVSEYNTKLKEETAKIKKEGQYGASKLIVELSSNLQKEKSDKIKNILGLTDGQLRELIGNSFVEWKEIGEQLVFAAKVLLKAREKEVEVVLNEDHTITNNFPDRYGNLPEGSDIKNHDSALNIPEGWLGVAPGPKTLDKISEKSAKSKLLILAGPSSIEDQNVEKFSGTNLKIMAAIKKSKDNGSITIGAGGDTAAAIRSSNAEHAFTLVTNAGGATLELIEKGHQLPGIKAIEECYKKSNQQF
jgi:3-phosphoglycerate kinase